MQPAQQLGTLLRAARRRLGLSQRSVAEAVGIQREYFSRIERGVQTPSAVTLDALLVHLQITNPEKRSQALAWTAGRYTVEEAA